MSLAMAAGVAAITAALATLAHVSADHTEGRLLRIKVAEAAAVLQAALPTVQTPLTAAAEFASGPPAEAVPAYRRYIGDYVGPQPKPFVSATLWALQPSGAARLLTTVGQAQRLAAGATSTTTYLRRAATESGLAVTGVLAGTPRRLGYAYAIASPHPAYAVYVESALPESGRVRTPPGTAFSDLRFAIYLGTTATPADLLEANSERLSGRTARTTVPFGDTELLLVAGSQGPLAGSLAAAMWWIVALAGGVLALIAGVVTERLVDRRRAAENLAVEVQTLLDRQRAIADAFQRAAVPEVPAAIAGVELQTRYVTGADDVDVGGDWYDAIGISEHRLFVVVGDVSGRGLEASTAMASLRAAVRAFISEGHPPAEVLRRLNRLAGESSEHFATVLCVVLDNETQTVSVSSAGHLPPLVMGCDGATFLRITPGPPIGVSRRASYREQRYPLRAGDTVLLFTDGVVERRDEPIETGLQGLADAAAAAPHDLAELLDTLVDRLPGAAASDDAALIAVRWSAAPVPVSPSHAGA